MERRPAALEAGAKGEGGGQVKWQPLVKGHGPGDGAYYLNSKYQVIITQMTDVDGVSHQMLSIRRQDRKPIMDWRDLQLIKNELLGPEEEMVQVFPAESRLVDTSNQYWAFHYPGRRWPFGFQTRLVTERLTAQVKDHGFSEQRPFADEHRPADLDEQEAKAREMFTAIGMKPVPREPESC